MDILNTTVFERKYDGLYMDNNLLFNEDLIPFYLNHDMFFYSKTRSCIFNMKKTKELRVNKNDVQQITTQENFIVYNDSGNIYICDDEFNVLSRFPVKVESNILIFGHIVVFNHEKELWSIDLATFKLSKYKYQYSLNTNEISGYIDDHKPVVCDTNTFHLSKEYDFRFGGSKMRVSHVFQCHYSKILRNIKISDECYIYDVFENTMKYICNSTCDIEIEKNENILELFNENYVRNFMMTNDLFTRDDYEKNRVILSYKNTIIDDDVKIVLNDVLMKMFKTEYYPAGPFYYYAPKHALSWHTNMETEPCSFRVYNVYCTKDYETFFCYLHPYSEQVHIIGDKNMHTSVFNIGPEKSPLWHAVINPSENVKRLSLGFLFNEVDDKEISDIVTERFEKNKFIKEKP